jgi:hypothetical protein
MPCDEYKKLNLIHQYAIKRVRRYAKPDEEPQLVVPTGHQLTKKLDEARAEEIEARLAMEGHKKTCKDCGQLIHGQQPAHLD